MIVLVLAALVFLPAPLHAQFQMPDAKEMSGIPRPVTDLPSRTVSVRVIRGELSNNIADHPVDLHIDSTVQTQKTDETGRAQFAGLTPGATLKAVAVVDGERLESQEFPAPSQGGIRLLLVATDKAKAAKAAEEAKAPPVVGDVVIAGRSRIIIEPKDENLVVYYLLDVSNNARGPVNPPSAFTLDVPADAVGMTVMDGSSPQAVLEGSRLSVRGPFAPGHTFVQLAYQVPVTGGSLDLTQRFPAALEEFAVVVKKVGDIKVTSPQFTNQQEFTTEGGVTYLAGMGPAIAAGQPIALSLTGLLHHSAVPRQTALALAIAIVAIGVWVSTRRNDDEESRAAERRRLLARRDRLMADLARLETDHRNGRGDAKRYATRREDLIGALEHIYGALDSDDTTPDLAA